MTASGLRADRRQIAPAFGHRLLAALERIGLAIARRHVGGERQALRPVLHPHHRGVAARPLHGVALNDVVVLLPDPALGAEIGRGDELFQRVGDAHRRLDVLGIDDRGLGRADERPLVFGRLVAELLDRQIGHHVAAVAHDEAFGRRGLADDGEVEPPFAEDRLGFLFLFRLEHHEHALLALRQHHLVGAHALFAARHLVEIERDAEIALGAHLDRRAGQPRRAHVLDGDDAALVHDFQTGFEQQLLRKRIADLHGRALGVDILAEFGRGHARRRGCRRGRSWSRDRRSACRRRRPPRRKSCPSRRCPPPWR